MAINFPDNPNINDVHTESSIGRSWRWDGTTWLIYSSSTTGIAFGDLSVSQQAASGGGSLTYNNAGLFTYTPPAGGGGGGSSTFVGLNDTPGSLTAGKWLKVNAGGTALEWTDAPSGGGGGATAFTGLNDTPSSFTANKWLKVNSGGTALEWTDAISVVGTITVANESTDQSCYPLFVTNSTGNLEPKTENGFKFNSSSGQLETGSFKKTGGTAAEFLKADGSIDSTSYLSSIPNTAVSPGSYTNTNLTVGADGRITAASNGSSGGGGGVSVVTSDTAPGSPSDGDLWWKSSTGQLKIYYQDADSSQWVDTNTNGGVNSLTLSVTTTTASGGGSLSYNNTNGVFSFAPANIPSQVQPDWDATTGLGEILNKPNIPAAQIQSDWDQTTTNALDYIKNKPTLFSGNYNDLSNRPTIPSAYTDTDVDSHLNKSSPTAGHVLSWSGTDYAWVAQSGGGGGDGNTTYAISCVDGDNADEEKIRLTDSSTSTDDIVLEAGTGLSIARSGDKITFTNTVSNNNTNTTYDLTAVAVDVNSAKIRLAGTDSTIDEVTLSAGNGISFNTSGNAITITSPNTIGALADVNLGGAPSADQIIKWSTTGGSGGSGAWVLGSQSAGFSGNYNDLTNQPTIPTNNNQLTNGAGYTTFDGAYGSLSGTPTIPTNNNQLTNGAGYITSSGTASSATNANNVKIRTDNDAAWHYPLFVDSNTDNLNQTLKVDASGMKYYPSLGWLQNTALQSYIMYDWGASSGSAGQVLTSQGSGQWNWTTPSSGGMTGNSKITVKTSGSGTHTTQSWCKSIVAIAVGGGGGGGNAWYSSDDDDPTEQGRGGSGGSGGHKYYTGSVSGAQGFSYSVGGGGSAQSSGSCDDNVANGASGGNTTFGGLTAGGGGGGQGTWYGTGSNGSDGSGDAIFFSTAYGKGGAGAVGRSGDGCQGSPGAGTGGAVFILELG